MVWNYPTIAALAVELAARLGVPLEAERAAAAPTASQDAAAAVDATDADLEAMLAEIERLSSDEARQQLGSGE
jgi:hypothetical protein